MSERDPLLPWLIFTGLCLFAFILLWYFGLIQRMIDSDRTFISPIICVLYLLSSLHCLWRILSVSREGAAAQRTGEAVTRDGLRAPTGTGLVARHIRDLVTKAAHQRGKRVDQTLMLRVLADRLRGSNAFGAFASDTMRSGRPLRRLARGFR